MTYVRKQAKELITPSQSEMRLIVQAALGETTSAASLKLLERLAVERLLLMAGAQASTRAASKMALGAFATVAIDVYQLKATLDLAIQMFSRPALPDPPRFQSEDHGHCNADKSPQTAINSSRSSSSCNSVDDVKILFGADAHAAEQRLHAYMSLPSETQCMHKNQPAAPFLIDWTLVTTQQPRIYIPRVFSNIGKDTLQVVVEEVLELGIVSHVELLPGPIDDFRRALIHMSTWHNAKSNPQAGMVRTKLLEGSKVTVFYDDPW